MSLLLRSPNVECVAREVVRSLDLILLALPFFIRGDFPLGLMSIVSGCIRRFGIPVGICFLLYCAASLDRCFFVSHIVRFTINGLAGRSKPYSQDLDRHVNVFFGLNGAGKTSLLKILSSAMNQDPSPDCNRLRIGQTRLESQP